MRKKCSHLWEMVNITHGLVVMKKCFHCSEVSTCFVFHNEPPLEPSHEGNHFWNFVESDPSFHFDLKCTKCGTLIKLDELVGLAKCVGCSQTCKVGIMMRKLEQENTEVYVAMGRRPIKERTQLSPEKLAVLQAYFSQQCKSLKPKIKIVCHKMVEDLGRCYAEVINNVDALFTASPKVK